MKSPRTPRGRKALAALAVGGGVALVAGITGTAAVAGSLGTTVFTDGTGSTVVSTITVPTAPPEILPLEIEKSAYPFYTRVNSWDIDKWASPQAGWDKKDQSVAVDYSVKVTKSWKAANVRVFGEIRVYNPNYVGGIAKVGDIMPGAECAVFPARLMEEQVAAQQTELAPPAPWDGVFKIGERSGATFRYICKLDKLPPKKLYNTAWAKFAPVHSDVITVPVEPTAAAAPAIEWLRHSETKVPVVFKDARYRDVNGVVKVIDTLDGDQTRLLDDSLRESKTFTYKRYLSFWRLKKICRTWENTAKVAPAPRPEMPEIPVITAAPELRMLPEMPEVAPEWPMEEWSETASATVKICPPPPPAKGEDPKPPTVEVTGPGDTKTDPVVVKPADNPKGPVVKDNKTKGRLLVTKLTRTRVARVGETVGWVIKVKNTGKAELYGIKVIDLLPKELAPAPSEANNNGNGKVVAVIKELGPGESEVIRLSTVVKGKPAPTPTAVAQVRKLKKAKERDEALRRLRRGLVCNVARATTAKGVSDSDITCIRIVRRPEVESPN